MNEKLERLGCKTFVYPNLSLIEEKGKELGLKNTTIEKARNMAIEYLKKTYHRPHYIGFSHLLSSFVYLAYYLEKEPRYNETRYPRRVIMDSFNVTTATFNKWNKDIIKVLHLNMISTGSDIFMVNKNGIYNI